MTSNVGSSTIAKGGRSIGFLSPDNESTSYAGLKALVMEELKAYFRPELLNRIDEVVVFRPLERSQVRCFNLFSCQSHCSSDSIPCSPNVCWCLNIFSKNMWLSFLQHKIYFVLWSNKSISLSLLQMLEILNIMLQDVRKRLMSMGIGLEVSESIMDLVCQQGYDQIYGARPLRRAVTQLIENLLSEALLSGGYKPGDTAVVDVDSYGNPCVTNGSHRSIHLSDKTSLF